ncbi:MAG TPA: hypothetical protein VIX41_08860 [Acidimicrobiales bacterium]
MVADVYGLIAGRLTAVFAALGGWSVWPLNPPDSTGLPAVWAELSSGGGASFEHPTMTPLVVRIVAVVAPQPTANEHAAFADVVDALDAGFRPPLAANIVTQSRSWTIDTVEVGGTDRNAVLYDLVTAHHPTC